MLAAILKMLTSIIPAAQYSLILAAISGDPMPELPPSLISTLRTQTLSLQNATAATPTRGATVVEAVVVQNSPLLQPASGNPEQTPTQRIVLADSAGRRFEVLAQQAIATGSKVTLQLQ